MPEFRPDLYQGVAETYDQFRLPYAPALIGEVALRTGADGSGRLLDLACGTGQVAFGLAHWFAEVWAVDQEPDMVAVVAQKAAGRPEIHPVVSTAEDLDAPGGSFGLVTMGNSFHRVQRDVVAARMARWLRPGGFVALLWSDSPWSGGAPWQQVLWEVMTRWQAPGRVPADWEQDRRDRPDAVVLAEAGFEPAVHFEVAEPRDWTIEQLTGFTMATSAHTRAALGDRAEGYVADLRASLAGLPLHQEVRYLCDLARRPPG
jgi:SAM-dependent methyltransferase